MILVSAAMVQLANATDYWDDYIPAGEARSMTIDLQGGQTVSGSFSITGPGHQVKFWVRDPTARASADDLRRRLEAVRKIWTEVLSKIKRETGLGPEETNRYYVQRILEQRTLN